jgi:hypothetical protein
LAKINVWAFLEKFGKMPFINTTHLPIWIKFYADSEFNVKIILAKNNEIFGIFIGIL